MTKRIYKYPIKVTDQFDLELPEDCQILKIAVQRGAPVMWAKVNPESPTVKRRFHVFGTGHPLPENIDAFDYHDTFLEGHLVWHLFENRIA